MAGIASQLAFWQPLAKGTCPMILQPASARTAAAGGLNAEPVGTPSRKFIDARCSSQRARAAEPLVHVQDPRGGRVDAGDGLDDLSIGDGMDFVAATCFGRQHAEQPGGVHRVIDDAGQPAIPLGVRSVFRDQRAKAFDLGE
jgi:hypothetical protein